MRSSSIKYWLQTCSCFYNEINIFIQEIRIPEQEIRIPEQEIRILILKTDRGLQYVHLACPFEAQAVPTCVKMDQL